MSSIKIRVRLAAGSQQTFVGREAWALKRLLDADRIGVTTVNHPAPRWSHYASRLRKAGLTITTDYVDFPGNPGRYRLETRVAMIEGPAR
jgi:hypothetical protein